MAPEIYDKKIQSEKTDVWSLGILLYEMFEKKSPFDQMKVEEIRMRVKMGVRFTQKTPLLARELI